MEPLGLTQGVTGDGMEPVANPMGTMGGPSRTIYDDLPPFLLHVKDSQAFPENNPDRRVQYFTGPNAMKTADEIAMGQLQPQQVQTPGIDLSKYDEVMGQIQGVLGQSQSRQLPKATNPQAPGIEQLAIAAILAFQNPEKAYEILAMPFNYGSQKAQQQDALNMQQFNLGQQQDETQLQNLRAMLGPLMDAATSQQKAQLDTQKFNVGEANDMATEVYKQSQMTERKGMSGPAYLYDQYMRMPGMTKDLAFNAAMSDVRLKEARKQEIEANTKTENETRTWIVENLKKTGKVLDERAKNLAEDTKYMGPTVGLKVAMFWLNLEQIKAQLQATNNQTAIKMFEVQSKAAEGRVSRLQGRIKDINKEIEDLKELQTNADKMAVYMAAHGLKDPKEAFNAIEREISAKETAKQTLEGEIEQEAVIDMPDVGNVPVPKQPGSANIEGWLKNLFGGGPGKAPAPERGSPDANVREAAMANAGKPYSLSRGKGTLDCSQYAQCVYKDLGYADPGATTAIQISKAQKEGRWQTSLDGIEPGDLVFTRGGGPNKTHVGVYAGSGVVYQQGTSGKVEHSLKDFVKPGFKGISKPSKVTNPYKK